MRTITRLAAIAAGTTMLAGGSNAGTVYTNQALFDASNPGLGQSNFASVPPGTFIPLNQPFTNEGVTFTDIYGGNGELYEYGAGFVGSIAPAIYTESFGDALTASFGSSGAVGLVYDEGYGGSSGPADITAYDGSTEVFSGTFASNGSDLDSFVGLSGFGPITSIEVDTSAYGYPEFPGIVAVEATGIGAVPEPATWALMLVGFGGLGLAVRMRRGMAVAN